MQAMKIIFLSASDGVVVDGELIGQLSIVEAEDFVKKKKGDRGGGAVSRSWTTPRGPAFSAWPGFICSTA